MKLRAVDLRNLSPSAAEKLAELQRSRDARVRWPWVVSDEAAMIAELGEMREPAVLFALLDFAAQRDSAIRRAAQIALARLLALVPSEKLPDLDIRMRESQVGWGAWRQITPSMLADLATDPHRSLLLGLASMHANGRVRDAALTLLAAQRGGAELPFFLLRLNDWVESIRNIARLAVQSRLAAAWASSFLQHLSPVLRLEHCGRSAHAWIIEAVADLLRSPACEPELRAGLKSPNRLIRRACLRFVADGQSPVAEEVLRSALSDCDPMIRLWAARRLLGTTAPADRASLAASLARDRFMPVRREALSALVTHDAANARDALMRALLDRHASMRDLARYHLRQIGDCDPAAFYRAAMSTQMEATLAIAIRGVGETGAASDASLLLPHLASQSVAVRRAAVAALARLGSRDFSGALLKALTDPSPSVSAEACRGLRAAGLARDADPLVALLSGHPVAFVRKNALRLVLQLGKWDRLAPILAACRDPEECVSAPAQAAVRTWLARYNRGFTKPTHSQMAAAERELRQSQEFLGSGTVRELSAIFSEFNR